VSPLNAGRQLDFNQVPCAHRRTMATSRGGRTWWAHCAFARINIQLTTRKKEIEEDTEVLDAGGRLASARVDARSR